MILQIADILTKPEVEAVRDALADEALWRDGKTTAAGRARAAKSNEQADAAHPAVKGAATKISRALLSHPVVKAAAQPARIARLMFSRYRPGMSYGAHVDAPYIDGARTDISFTLFLSEPDSYDGGALVVDAPGAEDRIRLPAGAVVLYPANAVHQVQAVTQGVRLAAVGWITSRIRLAEQRALVFELETALAELAAAGAPEDTRDRLANLRNNLLRLFGE